LGELEGGSAGHPPAATRRRLRLAGPVPVPAHKLPRGDTRRSRRLRRPSWARRELAALFAALLVGAGVGGGCGESGGAAEGAIVTAYVAEALCAEAKRELAHRGGEAGDLRVRAVCLPSAEGGGKLELATIGANARRATEDSSSIAYIGEPTQAASRFASPILEEAGVPQLSQTPGAAAMSELMQALERASAKGGSLRASVGDELG